jgi:hypothetical protein
MRKAGLTLLVAAALAATALLTMAGTLDDPVRWTPDGLFYQARSLELQGTDRDVALERVFQGPLGAELGRVDPDRSGDPDWVAYNAKFYERRITVPAAAAAIEPVAGDKAILDISVAGYVAAILAIFALLLLRFRLPVAAAVTVATIALPALRYHSSFPLTDSWGVALQTAAFVFGLLTLDRGPRWLLPWVAAILLLSFTRDSVWIPIIAAFGVTLNQRSKDSLLLLGSAFAAALPALLIFSLPLQDLLATMLNGIQPSADTSWSFIADRYPGAFVDLLQADGGHVRDGAWYSAAFLIGGLALLFLLGWGRRRTPASTFLQAGALAGVAYILVVPIFSAFRLELVCVPMAAFGLALGAEWAIERLPQVAWARTPALPATRPRP